MFWKGQGLFNHGRVKIDFRTKNCQFWWENAGVKPGVQGGATFQSQARQAWFTGGAKPGVKVGSESMVLPHV